MVHELLSDAGSSSTRRPTRAAALNPTETQITLPNQINGRFGLPGRRIASKWRPGSAGWTSWANTSS